MEDGPQSNPIVEEQLRSPELDNLERPEELQSLEALIPTLAPDTTVEIHGMRIPATMVQAWGEKCMAASGMTEHDQVDMVLKSLDKDDALPEQYRTFHETRQEALAAEARATIDTVHKGAEPPKVSEAAMLKEKYPEPVQEHEIRQAAIQIEETIQREQEPVVVTIPAPRQTTPSRPVETPVSTTAPQVQINIIPKPQATTEVQPKAQEVAHEMPLESMPLPQVLESAPSPAVETPIELPTNSQRQRETVRNVTTITHEIPVSTIDTQPQSSVVAPEQLPYTELTLPTPINSEQSENHALPLELPADAEAPVAQKFVEMLQVTTAPESTSTSSEHLHDQESLVLGKLNQAIEAAEPELLEIIKPILTQLDVRMEELITLIGEASEPTAVKGVLQHIEVLCQQLIHELDIELTHEKIALLVEAIVMLYIQQAIAGDHRLLEALGTHEHKFFKKIQPPKLTIVQSTLHVLLGKVALVHLPTTKLVTA